MKRNLTERDLYRVGIINGKKVYHNCCVLPFGPWKYPAPIYYKTAKEYDLICDVCHKRLVNV